MDVRGTLGLHEAMEVVLRQNGNGWMTLVNLAAEIGTKDLYRRGDGLHADPGQLRRRATSASYVDAFEFDPKRRIRLAGENGSAAPVAPVGESATEPTVHALLTENDVIAAVCDHLQGEGFAILERATTKDHGVDIVARREDGAVLVEGKGATSSKPGTKRYGKPFNGAQVSTHVSRAFFTAAVLSQEEDSRAAMALPVTTLHQRRVEQIARPAAQLGVGIFWVRGDLSVQLEAPWTL